MSLSSNSRLTGKTLLRAYESKEVICSTAFKVVIIQAATIDNYYGGARLNKVYLDEEIVGITHQWNVSLEV